MYFWKFFKQIRIATSSLSYSLIILAVSSCGISKYEMKSEVTIKHLAICTDFEEGTDENIKLEYEKTVRNFIDEYNNGKHLFQLDTCLNKSQSALRLKIKPFKYVGKNTQVAIGILNAIGALGLPITLVASNSPFIIAVAFPLNNTSIISHKLTKDLTINPKTHIKKVSNSALFIGRQKQGDMHRRKIKKFLTKELKAIENSQRNKPRIKGESDDVYR